MCDDLPEMDFAFTARKTTNSIAWQVSFQHFLQALFPQSAWLNIQPALDDSEQVLLFWPRMGCDAAVQPANGSRSGFLKALDVFVNAADHIVQLHHNIRTNFVLALDTLFWRQHHLLPINRRLKLNSSFRDLGQL